MGSKEVCEKSMILSWFSLRLYFHILAFDFLTEV